VIAVFVSPSISPFTKCCRLSCLMSPSSSRKRNRQNISMYQCDSLQSIAEMPRYMKSTIASDTTTVGNLVVPSIGVGTISWSSKSLTKLENLELQRLVDEARKSNIGFFDTAERYGNHMKTALGLGWGETEELLRKLLHDANAGVEEPGSLEFKSIIATKFTPSPWRSTVESVVEACEQSRQRLGVEQIDLYQLHMPDIVQPLKGVGIGGSKDEIYWEGLAECYKRGLVKNVGVSNYGPSLLERCMDTLSKHDVPIASNQITFSLIGRQNGSLRTLEKCSELGVKVLACYPYAMGLLTGKYNSINHVNGNESTSLTTTRKSRLEQNDLMRYSNGDGKGIPQGGITPLLETMESIANDRGKTVANVALNYIMSKGAIPLAGAQSAAQFMDNIGAMGWRLDEREVKKLEEESDKLGFTFEGAGFKRTNEKFVGYGVESWKLD